MSKLPIALFRSTVCAGIAAVLSLACSENQSNSSQGSGNDAATGGSQSGSATKTSKSSAAANGGNKGTNEALATGGSVASTRTAQGGSRANGSAASSDSVAGGESGTPMPTGGKTGQSSADATGGKSTSSQPQGGSTAASGGTKTSSGGRSQAGGASSGSSKTTKGGASGTVVGASGGSTSSSGSTGTGGSSGGAATCPSNALKPGDSDQVVKVGSLNRTYVLHLPTGYTGTKPLPLIVDFHPLGGTGANQERSNGWKAKADSVGIIMAYPDSYNSNNSWNAGMCCQDAQQNKIDDVGFTRAMIQQIEGIACVDTKRIYVTGCSNGGGMSYKVACDLADVIAAAAPVDFRCVYGGSTSSPSCEGCKPARPISITHFDNTGDTALVPYKGGMTSFPADCPPGGSCTGMGFPSAEDNFKTWQGFDKCTGSASALSGHSTCTSNSTCEGGAQVTMCVQQGGSHCGNYSSLGIVDIAWEMFQKQALP